MGLRDNSPVPNTCPFIDEAIEVLNNSECYYNSEDISSAIKALEKVRGYTSELREWGNNLFDQVNDLKEEISTLEDKQCVNCKEE